MTLLYNCQELTKTYGTKSLFEKLSFSIFSQDRIGLIGPNGSGKSTLLKILVGQETPNSGILSPKKGLKIGYVPQTCEFPSITCEEVLLEVLSKEMPDYEKDQLVRVWLSKLGFKEGLPTADRLSGGWKKRLSFAKELIQNPDLLLLDEPTNHLDLEGILFLEKFLLKESIAYVLVSHDRYFLQNMTNRIVEMDRIYPEGIFSLEGNYLHFLEKKEEFIKGQIQQERSIATKARKELDWLRQSPKARTTKSQARIDDAYEILDELATVKERNTQRVAKIDFAASERETRKLLTAKNLSICIGGRTLFKNLDFTLSPGTRMGLMGPNGSGKTTLLKILADELAPELGTVKRADQLQIVYFDQHRNQLPGNLTLREALSPEGDFVKFRGQQIHVNGWCKRFLFSPHVLDMPISYLSGGERARISIAHLMLKPADLLLLDEPTNDLDIATLETLEETLLDFPGAVVLITHDRCMLDRTCNVLLSLGDLEKNQLFSDYSQWEASLKSIVPKVEKKKSEPATPAPIKTKLTYNEKREYEQIEEKILHLENEVKKMNHLLEGVEFANDPHELQKICNQVALAENQIEQLYIRWEELEKKLK